MKQKKIALLLTFIILLTTILGGCSPKDQKENIGSNTVDNDTKVEDGGTEKKEENPSRIFALKGPTAMGLIKLFKDIDNGEENYTYTIGNSPEEAIAAIGGGKADILTIPGNMAASIYNKNKNLKIAGINTLGVLYFASSGDEIHSFDELKGKTILLSGKGATPEFALKVLLKESNLSEEDVTLEFKSEHTEVVQGLGENPSSIGLLPQPFLTVATTKNDSLHPIFDLNNSWKEYFDHDMVTGVVVVTKDFAENHPEKVRDFLEKYKESVYFVNENIDEASELIGSYDIFPAPVAKKAIPYCNIVMIDGEEMEKTCDTYFKALFEVEPKAVGGMVPDGEIYFK